MDYNRHWIDCFRRDSIVSIKEKIQELEKQEHQLHILLADDTQRLRLARAEVAICIDHQWLVLECSSGCFLKHGNATAWCALRFERV
jgi:hypothetical protein